MKRITLFVLMVTSVFTGAFSKDHLPSEQDYKAFLKSKTLVVMDTNPMSDFNFKIKEVMEDVWTVTDYDFISQQEFEDKKGDPSYSFLLSTTVTFSMDKTKARYTFLSLLMGKSETEVRDLPDLCSIPLSYLRVEDDSYAYKMEAFVRFIQDHVNLMIAQPDLIKANVFKYYNKNIKSLKDKTLYLVKDDLASNVNTLSKINNLYPYDVKLVTQEEVEQALKRKDPNIVILHKVGPEGTKYKARCYKILVGAADSRFYYFDYHMINKKKPDGLLDRDLKQMGSR
ncbi:hypothetical protein [Carboxylicivirga linearis]|uniref:DUF4837 family protein n=1 Tax=Carboxylicivirga linearis TaxID=1628157 RepID=A0ABS5JQU0_9BACT|nr:hypothetical protein [Carboxylicivirga linearis]MBS2097221.1 hypothetical protein [Carboxylicivirga linearis]